MRILVTDGMDKSAMAQLREQGHEVVEQFYEPDQLGKALRDFDAVVVRSKTKVRANHIDEAKGSKLKLIIRGGVGVDNIDVKYAEENGIKVMNTPRASSQSVAELALGHMFSCARYLSIAGHTMREDKDGQIPDLCGATRLDAFAPAHRILTYARADNGARSGSHTKSSARPQKAIPICCSYRAPTTGGSLKSAGQIVLTLPLRFSHLYHILPALSSTFLQSI